jgi:hypothetical protein
VTEFLQNGLEWLAGELKGSTSREVVYCRDGAGVCKLRAVPGSRPLRRRDGEGGVLLDWQFTDWIVLAADLKLGGRPVLPEDGDTVEERRPGGKTRVYEVLPPEDDEPSFRFCDSDEKHLRIHTKLAERKGVC